MPNKVVASTRKFGAPATVPESVLKKRKTLEEVRAARADRLGKAKVQRKKVRKVIFKKAEQYAKEYRQKARDTIRLKRVARAQNNYYKEAEPSVLFVIRIRGINRMAPKTKKILQLLRLRQIHNGVFVKANKASLTMLKLVEPYVTYGAPTVKTISDLIYKRGHGKQNKQRIPLTNNQIIQKSLGQFGVICIEDLIHEIATCGEHFKEVNNFLWPFKLSSPLGGYALKRRFYSEGGSAGRRDEGINAFVARMN